MTAKDYINVVSLILVTLNRVGEIKEKQIDDILAMGMKVNKAFIKIMKALFLQLLFHLGKQLLL